MCCGGGAPAGDDRDDLLQSLPHSTGRSSGAGKQVPIIVMGLDLDDPDALDPFMPEVAEALRSQRMCSPPETTAMFITLIGKVGADDFKLNWAKEVSRDPILRVFMDQMKEASVLHCRPDGTIISHISLI